MLRVIRTQLKDLILGNLLHTLHISTFSNIPQILQKCYVNELIER